MSNNKWKKYNDLAKKRRGIYEPGKILCKICGLYYKQLGTHVYYEHHMHARDYKKEFGLDVKKGLITEDIRKVKRAKTLKNGTIKNLFTKKSLAMRFKKGDKRAGNYTRSEQTMDRLRTLYKFNKVRSK